MTYQDASKVDGLLRTSSNSLDPCNVTKVEGILSGFLLTMPQVQSRNNLFAVRGARSGKDIGFSPSSLAVLCQLSLLCYSIFMRYLWDRQ